MVVIEIIGSEGKTPRFERAGPSVIRVGRALDNDVIIDDPYIDAHHLVVDVSEPDNWHLEDLGSANGTFKAHEQVDKAAITSGDELLVGKTRIRIFSQHHRVAPAKSLKDLEHLFLSFNSVPVMIGLMVLLAALPCLALYFNALGKPIKPDAYLFASTSMLGSTVAVAAFWSLIAKLLRGEWRFRVLFNITMVSGLLSALFRPMIGVISYNMPGAGVDVVVNLLASAIVGGVYMYIVLLLGTRLSSTLSQAIAVVVATGTIGTYAITEYSGKDDFQPYPHYDGQVYAPAFLFRHGDTPAEFRHQLPSVFARADEMAARESKDAD